MFSMQPQPMGAMDQISTCFLTIPRVPPHIPPPSPVLLSHSCSTTNRLAGDCPPSDPCPLVQATGLPCCRQLAIDVQGANLEAKVGWSAPALLITGKVAPNSQVLTLESLLWIVTSPMCFCLCECCWEKTEVAGLLQLQRQKGKGCHKRQHIASYLYSQNPCTSKKKEKKRIFYQGNPLRSLLPLDCATSHLSMDVFLQLLWGTHKTLLSWSLVTISVSQGLCWTACYISVDIAIRHN